MMQGIEEEITLPDSVLAALSGEDDDEEDTGESGLTEEQLDTLEKTLVTKRSEYRQYRTLSGIEHTWQHAEEFYIGYDEANAHEFNHVKTQVPAVLDGPVVQGQGPAKEKDDRCILFPRVPARYVDAGTAKVCEILIPPDEKSFSYDATPVPTLLKMAESEVQVLMPPGSPFAGQPAERNARPDEIAGQPTQIPQAPAEPGQAPEQAPIPPGVPILERDLAAEDMEKAQKAAKKAEKRVEDWHVEANYAAKTRRVIFDSAKLGVGVMKGPFPTIRKAMAITKDPKTGNVILQFEEKVCPDYKAVSPWNLFPSPSCGENVRDGEGLWERDYLSRSQVEALAEMPGYITKKMNKVIDEGPQKRNTENADPTQPQDDVRYEVWYWYGSLSREEWDAIQNAAEHGESGAPKLLGEEKDKPLKSVYVTVTMINDCIVYASQNTLKSGLIPFYTFPWQIRSGSWAGVGIIEQIDMGVRLIVAATRALIDNAGLSAGSQIVVNDDAIDPEDGSYVLRRNKLWKMKEGYTDVRQAFGLFQIPNTGPALMEDIEYGFRIVEESCNIPLVSQGQSGKTTPDTFGGMQLQDNNANQLLRGIAATYDDCVTEPQARADYEWLLLDEHVPDEEKGDFRINAHGSSAFVERAIQDQAAIEQLELVIKAGDAIDGDPKKAYTQYLKAKRLNPSDYKYTKEESERRAKTPPPKDPRLQAEEIKAQVKLKEIAADTDRDTVYVDAETKRTQQEYEARMQELAVKREIELMKYANMMKISINEVKSQLAQTGMKLAVQKQLAGMSEDLGEKSKATPEMTTPPTEPKGKAETGRSFEQ